FKGKGGQEHDIALDDKRLARLVRGVQQLPGQALFQYRDDDGGVRPVDSGEVNDYLRAAMGQSFTAKDFRTWGGTLAAFQRLALTAVPEDPSERALKMLQNEVIKSVADALGNTPAVCRKAYIDPCTFVGWREGSLQRVANGARGERQWEQATLKFLARSHRAQRKAPASDAKEKST
ncbi:MAG: DNA topoisomerase IB, partial [Lysobacteraceae bacterium]